jgi:hypothetical protein
MAILATARPGLKLPSEVAATIEAVRAVSCWGGRACYPGAKKGRRWKRNGCSTRR